MDRLERAYRLGFIAKCAERGVPPYEAGAVFVKLAQQQHTGKEEGGPTWQQVFRSQAAPAASNANNFDGAMTQDEYNSLISVAPDYGMWNYNRERQNIVNPYSNIHNQYYRGLMGKTEGGHDDDSQARIFAKRMQDIDRGKPSTWLNRWWRNIWWSPEENREYFKNLANERAQRVLSEMEDDRMIKDHISRSVARLRPGAQPTAAPATATSAATPAAVSQQGPVPTGVPQTGQELPAQNMPPPPAGYKYVPATVNGKQQQVLVKAPYG